MPALLNVTSISAYFKSHSRFFLHDLLHPLKVPRSVLKIASLNHPIDTFPTKLGLHADILKCQTFRCIHLPDIHCVTQEVRYPLTQQGDCKDV